MKKNPNKEAYTVTQNHSMVCMIEKSISISEEMIFLLLSDLHFDHPKCNRELLKHHIEECIRKDGYILINGDFFCIMQGKYDKRHNKSDVRPEHMNANYFDSVVDEAVEFFKPYAERILFIGYGNHETSVIKRTETDLLRKFTDLIYYQTNHRIALGEYHGWIWIKGLYGVGPNRKRRMVNTLSYLIYHNHGTGGEAPVTGGSIEDNRKTTQVEGMDAIWQSHNHNKYHRQVAASYLDKNPQSFKPKIRMIDIIRTGTYKQEYTGRGFHIETNKAPKPLGGSWLILKPVWSSKTNAPCGKAVFLSSSIISTWHEPIEIE